MSVDPEPFPDDFTEAFAAARSRFGRLGSRTQFFQTIHSTNDVASAIAGRPGAEGAVVVADTQTAGRGRRGRQWFSPAGAGLYVSIVLEPRLTRGEPERAVALLTLAAGVALAEAIERATGLHASIKWPNDLLVDGRKLAGILAEGILGAAGADGVPQVASVVLGYGINVAQTAFPPELAGRSTSLETELGRAIDRGALCAETIASMAARYDDLLAGRFDAILDAWHARAPESRGGRVQWDTPEGTRTGITAGVDRMGALLVRVGATTERLVAGEVSWSSRTS